MKRKRKGYALLLAIEALFIFTMLATVIVSLAAASYKSSVRKEKLEKLKLKSESAIEIQYTYLKDYIMKNPIVLVDSSKYDIDAIKTVNVTDEGIRITTTISNEANVKDVPTGRKVDCLKIEAQAQFLNKEGEGEGRILKTTVYIDKDSIYNEYFERIFKSSFTTSPKEPLTYDGDIESGFSIYNSVELIGSGNMLLQGTISLNPGRVDIDEGEVLVKSPEKLKFSSNNRFEEESRISRVEGNEGFDIPQWVSRNTNYLYFCDILDQTTLGAKPIAIYTPGVIPIDMNSLEFLDIDNTSSNSDIQNTVTYKVRSDTDLISFQYLINGDNRQGDIEGLYPVIIEKLTSLYPDLGADAVLRFGEFYKVLLIDGDLIIENDKEFLYNNYVIYCSGKVTFEGDAYFYNSSIFAKEIELNNGKVIFNGINTRRSSEKEVGNRHLTDFSNKNKGAISSYLLKNLANYGDYLKFRVVKWEQQ